MIDLLDVENDKGYKIYVGADVLPTDVRLNIDTMNKLLDQYKDLKITSDSDYIDISDKLTAVKSMRTKISECEEKSLGPINDLVNTIVSEIDPTKNKVTETEVFFKQLILDWEMSAAKRREEELALEEQRKAEELEKQRKAEELEKQRKAEELERQIKADELEEQRKAEELGKQKKEEVEMRIDKEGLTPENFSKLSIDKQRTILEDYRNLKINIEEPVVCPTCHTGHIHSVEPDGVSYKCTDCGKVYIMVDTSADYKCANCGVPISEKLKMDACPFCKGKKAFKFDWGRVWKMEKPIMTIKKV
jgi:Zn finger protein HypA/HybF involved in hydrogenase expression